MNKIILGCVGLLLIFAVPAMAEVTITATQVSGSEVEISYSGATAGNPVRAFALDITLDNPDAKIVSVTAAKRGISTSAAPGYGIFPASFAREINPSDPNWDDADYTPAALLKDLPSDTQPGIDSNGITVELGSLYDGDANKPLTGDLLLTLTIDAPEMAIVDLDILENASRGGRFISPTSVRMSMLSGWRGVVAILQQHLRTGEGPALSAAMLITTRWSRLVMSSTFTSSFKLLLPRVRATSV